MALLLALVPMAGCQNKREDSGKLKVIATLFPQYDFARTLAGDKAQVELLLPLGVESHSFDPKPSDIVAINNCSVFLYTGKYMESWAEQLVSGIDTSAVRVVDLSSGITLDKEAEHDGEEGNHEGHDHAFDPHIWTSPVNAMRMVRAIADSLCAADEANAAFYRANEEQYLAELKQLDNDFRALAKNAVRKDIIFGGRYPFHYFEKEYGLNHIAAFDSCSAETEPSAAAIASIINKVKQENIPVVYYEELTEPKVARSICGETGAKMLLLHSCHNVSKTEYEQGATYLSLMRQNLENLKEGLL